MGFVSYNANTFGRNTFDCIVRALSVLMDITWEEAYVGLTAQGLIMRDMPISDLVWNGYLRKHGYHMTLLPDYCPDCYTVRKFCEDHPRGRYMLKLRDHVVAVIDGDYYDTWNSGEEIPIYYWSKGE